MTKILPLLVVLGALCACGDVELPPPVLWRVCLEAEPAPCRNEAPAGQPLQLYILGEGLQPAFAVDLDQAGDWQPRAGYRGRLGWSELYDLEPLEQPWQDLQVVRGEFRGDLPAGVYPVQLTTPSGRSAILTPAVFLLEPGE